MELATQQQASNLNQNAFNSRNLKISNQNAGEMTISIEKKINHPCPTAKVKSMNPSIDSEQLKQLFTTVLEEKNEMNKCNMDWVDDKTVVVDELSGLTLHNFLLRVEELGKNISFTKKTVIEIH
jgi:hypothetical protein